MDYAVLGWIQLHDNILCFVVHGNWTLCPTKYQYMYGNGVSFYYLDFGSFRCLSFYFSPWTSSIKQNLNEFFFIFILATPDVVLVFSDFAEFERDQLKMAQVSTLQRVLIIIFPRRTTINDNVRIVQVLFIEIVFTTNLFIKNAFVAIQELNHGDKKNEKCA